MIQVRIMVFFSFILRFDGELASCEECFSSFYSQSSEDYEIICINTDDFINLSDFTDKINIVQTSSLEDIPDIVNGEIVCFLSSSYVLSDENTLSELKALIEKSDCDIFALNTQFNSSINYKNVFFNHNLKYLANREVITENVELNLCNFFFKSDFLKDNKKFLGEDDEIIVLSRLLLESGTVQTVPITLFNEENTKPFISEDIFKLFSTYFQLLELFYNDYPKVLNDVSANILENKFKVPELSLEEYEKLEKEFFKIEDILNEKSFEFSHKIISYFRYIKEIIESKIKRYETSISIIIPTYNVEKYIGECLNSLINQSFTDFEVIVVDDKSTDSTLDILDFYSRKDERIKYFKNSRKMGSGGSRNYGLSKARGKYVEFVDGDDWLDLMALERLFNFAEKYNVQTVMFKVVNFTDNGTEFIKDAYLSIPSLKRFNNKLFSFNDISDELFEISVVPMNKLYLRSFLMDINARFPEKYIHQDNPFFYQTFCESELIYLDDEYLYNRRLWKGSITHLRDDTELGTIEIVEEILKVFINNKLYCEFSELLLNRLLYKLRNRYTLVGDDYKEEYFIRSKRKLNKFMFEYGLYDDLKKYLWKENRNFFNRIIYSNTYNEFLNK